MCHVHVQVLRNRVWQVERSLHTLTYPDPPPRILPVAEALLHQVELAGGSPGSFLGQRVFRHKISKLAYQRGFSQVLAVQIAASIAWGYFHGPSWALLGVGIAPAVVLAATAKRISTLKRRDDSGRKWHQPWQRPVDVSASARRRRNTDTSKRATPFK
ncbi:unnamed protein product [Ectocarpus fasciculatus]